jgi:hypothetical protein
MNKKIKEMKSVYKNLTVIIVTLFLTTACGDMMDLHQEFIRNGETVYMPKPDSVKFLAGNKKIYFECMLRNAPNVTTIDIFWNRGKDSLIIPVNPGTGIFMVRDSLTNMGEQSYTFEVQASDAYNQHSLRITGFANSYGDLYQQSLVNRPYRGFALTDRNKDVSVELAWISAASGLIRSEVRYDDESGVPRTIRVLPSEMNTICEKATVNSVFEYRSAFLPEPDAVDTFYTAWKQITPDPNYTLGMDGWTVTASSYDASSTDWGPPAVILEPGPERVWHTRYSGSTAQLPHWIEIDMQNLKSLTRLEVIRYTDIKTLNIITSETQITDKGSLKNLTPVASLEYPGPWTLRNIMRSCDFEEPVSARYMYLYMQDSHRNPYSSIQEIKVFGWTQ